MPPSTWHEDVFFGLHYDLHANEADTVLGSELTPENLREQWQKVKPDWVQCDCKGHPGWTSWPTEVGSTSPGVVRDSLRVHADVCRELGIRLGMHYSGVIDQRALALHPEWGQVGPDGTVSNRSTCRLSPYLDELMIPQLLELVEKYDVDGFWVDGDCWAVAPCYCERCREEFQKRTALTEVPKSKDEPHWEQWAAFHRDLFVEYVTRYADAVHAAKPDCAVCSNWAYTVRMPEPVAAPVDYLSGDYMPNFGAYRAALEARSMSRRGLSWDLMCWGFTKHYTANYDCLWKTATHLSQEVAGVVAQGGAVMVYAKPHRTGHLVGWHHDILAEVADFCRARRPFCFQSETVPQAAILHPADHYYANNTASFNYGDTIDPLEGALHALLETHHSTDLLGEELALEVMNDYKLLVVPERTRLSQRLVDALENYAQRGGTVVLSGSHLAAETPDLIGARATGEEIRADGSARGWGAVYLEIEGETASCHGPWAAVEVTTAEVHTLVCRNSEPARDRTETPALTRRVVGSGALYAIHGPLFREYFHSHCPRLRRFFRTFFDGLGLDWLVTLDAPPQVELVLRRKDGRLMINLLNRGAGEMTYDKRVIVDQVPPVPGVRLRVRCEHEPTAVTQQPAGVALPWTWRADQGVAEFVAEPVRLHEVIVVE